MHAPKLIEGIVNMWLDLLMNSLSVTLLSVFTFYKYSRIFWVGFLLKSYNIFRKTSQLVIIKSWKQLGSIFVQVNFRYKNLKQHPSSF